ncbi:SH3 domain-containing protein [uncultured Roseibium sp.]|uniref:SH3 domain-containing protein n=1 Tax=uncultured Roseibium sp. TaxID=1936171 RepID=UPI002601B178|nr:SH3 domain-containing protein [uncultured Roseibium sp.]
MYSFSAPAIACDPFADRTPDNANLPATKSDLRLVEVRKPATESSVAEGTLPPPGLAGKILQMHAAADAPEPEIILEETDRPKPDTSGEEASLEMLKSVRKKLEDGVPLEPNRKAVSWDRSRQPAAQPVRHGPGFKALIASTLAIIALGGGALALTMAGLPGNGESSALENAPQLTAAETTLEDLIVTSVAEPGVSTIEPAVTDGAAAADAEGLQIARAKEKLREAFAAQGLTGSAADSGSAASQEGKIQARLDVRQITVPVAPSESTVEDLPVLALAANDAPVEAAGSTAIAAEVSPLEDVSKADGNAEVVAAAQETGAADPSFPNSGKIAAAVNLRQSADSNAEILTVVPAGADVRFGNCGPWWCNILHEGQTGYVGQKFLEKSAQVD